MALILKNSIFLHVPKTGGMWVRYALDDLVLEKTNSAENSIDTVSSQHDIPSTRGDFYYKSKFCFVRHPVTYYRSYWAFRMNKGWHKEKEIDLKCANNDFSVFIDSVIQNFPHGYLTEMYGHFVQWCDFVGLYEDLPFSLLDALLWSMEPFDTSKIVNAHTEKINRTDETWLLKALYAPHQVEKIMQLEGDVVRQFYL